MIPLEVEECLTRREVSGTSHRTHVDGVTARSVDSAKSCAARNFWPRVRRASWTRRCAQGGKGKAEIKRGKGLFCISSRTVSPVAVLRKAFYLSAKCAEPHSENITRQSYQLAEESMILKCA